MKTIESIIDRQLRKWELEKARIAVDSQSKSESVHGPVITIARMLGAHGEQVAQSLTERIGFQLFDRELLEAIANDFGVQTKMVEMLDEAARSELESWFAGMIRGRIIDSSDYIRSLTRAVGALSKHGASVIVGRGANIILGPCRGFHIRVVSSRNVRIRRIASLQNMTYREAEKIVDDSDAKRAEFTRKSFGADINDPALYDMVVNTDILSVADAVELILSGYNRKRPYLTR